MPFQPSPLRASLFVASAFFFAGCGDKPQVNASLGGATPTKRAEKPRQIDPERHASKNEARVVLDQDARDKMLIARVRAALAGDPELKDMAVDATVHDSVVTLHGTARNPERRERAARLVSRIEGVRSVDNGLILLAGS